MKIEELKPLEKNPFKSKGDNQLKLISKSIQDFEKMMSIRKIVIDENNEILGGNKRYHALKLLGYKEVPSDWIDQRRDLTEEEKKRFIVTDNAHYGSQWDFEMLQEWGATEEWGIEFPEWETDEVLEAEEDNFDSTPPEEPITVLGDLYEIGEHRLLCGDSTDSDQVAKLMDGDKADMVFTDPPYGINEKGDRSKRGGLTKGNKLPDFKDDTIQYAIDAFNQPQNFDIPIQVWFGANYYCHSLPQGNNWLVWDKRVEEKQRDTQSDCELGWVKSRFNSVRIFRHLWKGMMKDSERGQKRVHATQKPIALIEFAINEYGENANLIIDYFTGSGSTMVASHQLKRKCYGMELDPKYCDVIVNRMIKLDPSLTIKRNGKDVTKEFSKKD